MAAQPGGEPARAGKYVGGHRQQRAAQPLQRLGRQRRAGRAGASAAPAPTRPAILAAVLPAGGQDLVGILTHLVR
jgi:hypothetical protein